MVTPPPGAAGLGTSGRFVTPKLSHNRFGNTAMSHRDFREFVAVAEQQGLLRRVRQSVDRSWEPACMAKWAFQALSNEDRFGLLFEDVEGSDFALCTEQSDFHRDNPGADRRSTVYPPAACEGSWQDSKMARNTGSDGPN